MRRVLILLLGTLGGCYTPGEIREQGARYEFSGKHDVGTTADCVERNASEISSMLTSRIRAGTTPGSKEVTLYNANGTTYVAVVSISTGGKGSKLEAYMSPMLMGKDSFAAAMVKDCL